MAQAGEELGAGAGEAEVLARYREIAARPN
jgi:hypothetical protein